MIKPVDLSEDFIQALKDNQIEYQRAELRYYDNILYSIEIYVECVGIGALDLKTLEDWGLPGAIISPVGPEMLSLYTGNITPKMIEKVIKEGGE